MKKFKSILLLTLMILGLAACGAQGEAKDPLSIHGGVVVDGMSVPVHISIGVENVLKGEDAYNYLHKHDTALKPADDNHEYIIVTLNVKYNDGELETLRMAENRATAEGLSLYFALSNESSNTTDITSSLENSVYALTLQKGESGTGAVAFLQEKGNNQPLYFVFYDRTAAFEIN